MSIAVHRNNSQTCDHNMNVHIVSHDGVWAQSALGTHSDFIFTSIHPWIHSVSLKAHNHLHHQVPFSCFLWITLELFSSSLLSHTSIHCGYCFFLLSLALLWSVLHPCDILSPYADSFKGSPDQEVWWTALTILSLLSPCSVSCLHHHTRPLTFTVLTSTGLSLQWRNHDGNADWNWVSWCFITLL